jgi:hypothetical protein
MANEKVRHVSVTPARAPAKALRSATANAGPAAKFPVALDILDFVRKRAQHCNLGTSWSVRL